MSSNGFLTGTYNGGVARGYRWSRTTGMIALDPPDRAYPLGVNASGLVVGLVDLSSVRAALWNPTSTFAPPTYLDDLNIVGKGGWVFNTAYAITDSGVIAGIGTVTTTAGTESHNFLLIPSGGGGGAMNRSTWTVTAPELTDRSTSQRHRRQPGHPVQYRPRAARQPGVQGELERRRDDWPDPHGGGAEHQRLPADVRDLGEGHGGKRDVRELPRRCQRERRRHLLARARVHHRGLAVGHGIILVVDRRVQRLQTVARQRGRTPSSWRAPPIGRVWWPDSDCH